MTSSDSRAKLQPILGYARLRLSIMGSVGVIFAILAGFLSSWWYAPVAGWAAAALSYVFVVWLHVHRMDADGTRTHATREDPGIVTTDLLIIAGSVASVVAVAVIVLRAAHGHGAAQLAVGALAFTSVGVTWMLIHTLYTLRYARLYYAALPKRVIDFGGVDDDDEPRYVDFAYLAFDLGMTYQVSDTTVRTSALRGVVLRHTVLSYVFGTVILASTINLVAGLSGS